FIGRRAVLQPQSGAIGWRALSRWLLSRCSMLGADSESNLTGPISLSDEEGVKQIVVESIFALWDTVNNLTRLQPSRRERYRVTIFGSARAQPGSAPYEETKRAAEALAGMGCDIITGGGPGLMQAANEGASQAPERVQSVGIR